MRVWAHTTYPNLEGCVKIYIIITRCDTPPTTSLNNVGTAVLPMWPKWWCKKKNDNCGGIGIHGGLVQYDWLRVNFSISCSRTETAGENTARSVISMQVRVLLVISSLRDRVDFYFKKILCDRPVSHRGWLHLICNQEPKGHVGSNPITGSGHPLSFSPYEGMGSWM